MTTVISMCMNLMLAAVNGLDCTAVPTRPNLAIEALCPEDSACLQGNGDGYFASMVPVDSQWYGSMAACPREIFGRSIAVMDLTLYCGDSFGFINGEPVETIRYNEEIGWFMHVDVFWPIASQGFPPWNAWHVASWEWAEPEAMVINLD